MGSWCDKDKKHWNKEAIQAINPVFGDDGTFWISFKDFIQHFRTINVCKVGDWEEVRVKGVFTNFPS
jgi:calpain-15